MDEPGGDSADVTGDASPRPLPPPPTTPTPPPPPPPAPPAPPSSPTVEDDLVLPPVEAKPPPPMVAARQSPPTASSTWYRSDQQRYRSVYRRANPWYRRLARALIALAICAVVGIVAFVAVDAIRDYVNRDKLPSPDVDVAEFRQSAFLVHSEAPAPALDGTLRIDLTSGAYQFVGGGGGPQTDTELVSPDGNRVYVRSAGGAWRTADSDDPVASAVQSVIPFLVGVNGPDDVLQNRMRQGYIDLVERTVVGQGTDAITTYQMSFDTAEFSSDYPLQWEIFREEVVPQMAEGPAAPVSMAVDADNVVVGLDTGGWWWQRLDYSSEPLRPLDPSRGTQPTVPEAVPPTSVPGG